MALAAEADPNMSESAAGNITKAIVDSKYFWSVVVSAPVMTAAFFVFGRRFSRMFYAELGVNHAVLDLTVQDYVIRSEGAFVQVFGRNLPVIATSAFAIWLVLALARCYPRALLPPLAVSAVVATWYAWPLVHDHRTTALLGWTAIASLAILAVRALVIEFESQLPLTASGAGPLAAVSLMTAVLFAFTTTSAATLEGRRLACVYDNQRSLAQSISLITDEPLGLATDVLRHDGQYEASGLRLISSTPGGLVVFYAERSPRLQTLVVRDDGPMTIVFDRTEPLIANPGQGCRKILGSSFADPGTDRV